MPLDMIGSPFPYKSIWLKGAGLQVPGWHSAVIVAVPGKVGFTSPEPAEMVDGVVELKIRLTPVSVTPLTSLTTAVSGRVVFTPTATLLVFAGCPGTERVMEVGGHVEKKPAAPPEAELVIVPVTIVEPG